MNLSSIAGVLSKVFICFSESWISGQAAARDIAFNLDRALTCPSVGHHFRAVI